MKTKNTWIENQRGSQPKYYLGGADDFIVEREVTRQILVQLFGLRFHDRSKIKLLELGCGDGYITAGIIEKYPKNHFTMLDGNEKMLDMAMNFLGNDSIEYIQSTFEDYMVSPSQEFDFIYSSNAVHHLNKHEKHKLYQAVFKNLNKGGLFLNIDVIQPTTIVTEKWQFQMWKEWIRARLIAKRDPSPNRHDRLPEMYKSKEENQPSGLKEQLEMFEKLGYENVDCFYKHGIFALFGGTKE